MTEFGKIIIFIGIILLIIGAVITLSPKVPFLGKLPGDFLIQKNGFSFYFPLATSIVISIILTILINLLSRK
ncbi:DUF2905 domain-containing protein [Candidatus Roizmanbacteria bacterium]|nr:DUF2905 domain-containing protein [Candidatus Roizmanbacteria bacterium]